MSDSLTLLVIEDDPDTRANLADILELDDHRVETAGSAAEALGPRDWPAFDAIILDRKLPDGTAEELLPRLRERAPEAAIIIVTGYGDVEGAITALRRGAWDYILKPINPEALRASLGRIAERKQLSLARRRSDAAFRTLVEAADCMILILRPDGAIAYFNPFAEELTGYPADEVLGRNYFEQFLSPESRQTVADQARRALSGRPIRGFENPIVCKDGSRRWMLWSARLLTDHEGESALLTVGQDITERKQAEVRVLQSERLAAIGQMVAGLAHESRNALQRSQACLEMLALELEDRPEALQLVSRIQRAQDHLHHLYEEVRGYAAPIHLKKHPCDLSDLVHDTWSHLELARRGRNVRLIEEKPEGIDTTCPVDRHALEQVLRNVLENAIAACPEPGEITVAYRDFHLEGRPALKLIVRDNGPGLSAEQQARIFEPFFTTKTHGTGLGMAIARRIVEAHGGRIRVQNVSPQGAEVRITLPRA